MTEDYTDREKWPDGYLVSNYASEHSEFHRHLLSRARMHEVDTIRADCAAMYDEILRRMRFTRDDINAMCDAAESMLSAIDKWQKVSDDCMPDPGAEVLAGYHTETGRWRTLRAAYLPEDAVECNCFDYGVHDCTCTPSTEDPDEIRYWPAGWYECCEDTDIPAFRLAITPTHWAQLPKPPESSE